MRDRFLELEIRFLPLQPRDGTPSEEVLDVQPRVGEMEEEIADLQIRIRGGKARIEALGRRVKAQEIELTRRRRQVEELTATKSVLEEGLWTLEENFLQLLKSKPFRFVIYTARRLGLVSRSPRLHVEAIRNCFPQMRRALEEAKKHDDLPLPKAADSDAVGRETAAQVIPPLGHAIESGLKRSDGFGDRARENDRRPAEGGDSAVRPSWYSRRQLALDKLRARNQFSSEPLTLAFAVTDAIPATTAGDFFTASELGDACAKEFGWRCRYLSRSEWYDLEDADVLIVLVDSYEISKIRGSKPDLVKIAWMRNWFERWTTGADFDLYDLFLCSSKKSAAWLRDHHGMPVSVFPLATNPERFSSRSLESQLHSDYCFTGSNWQFEREIAAFVQPEELPGYKFVVFGSGWESHPRLGPYSSGFVPYAKMPDVYAATRIVVDDANHVTREWGSVNSRVFDALAAGALVISNGEIGALEVFDGRLPTYRSAAELQARLRYYLGDDIERRQLAGQLRETVLASHTYRHRARLLKRILITRARRSYRVAIKITGSIRDTDKPPLDFHFARSLGRSLAAHGHSFRIDGEDDWHTKETFGDNVVIVLRGARRYRPQQTHINLMWILTPENITDQEYQEFDHVFVASHRSATELTDRLETPVAVLFPCADPGQFYPDPNPDIPAEALLFIGDYQGTCPASLRIAVERDLPVGVYGKGWENIIDFAHIRDAEIEPSSARQLYSRADISIVEGVDSMRERGFVSRQLFEAGASGAFMIADPFEDAESLFGQDLVIRGGQSDFLGQIRFFLAHAEERRRLAERLRARVLSAHTFANRTDEILAAIKLGGQRKRGSTGEIGSPGDRRAQAMSY